MLIYKDFNIVAEIYCHGGDLSKYYCCTTFIKGNTSMKKLLVALLATAGITSAFAQSSVSVYGIIDAGYLGTNYTGVGTSSTAKQTTSGFGQSAESASRLGFKGTEDLGNGTSAFFLFETMLRSEERRVGKECRL